MLGQGLYVIRRDIQLSRYRITGGRTALPSGNSISQTFLNVHLVRQPRNKPSQLSRAMSVNELIRIALICSIIL